MSGWLSRATSLFQQPLPSIEPFAVECDCGGKVVGQRTSTHLRPICPACERPVFVLPANVYPQPKLQASAKNQPAKQSDGTKSGRISTNVVADVGPQPPPTKSPTVHKLTAGRTVQPQPAPEPAILREPRTPLITPLRMIAAAIVLVSAVTVGGLWHRQRIERAKTTVARSTDSGMVALRERDFVKAAYELDKARLAVDLLGRTDRAAHDIRRLSREATALAKLASNSLTEFLQETLSNGKPDQTEPLRMASLDKNAWVLFDACMIPTGEGRDRFVIDAPILLREGIVRIEIESPIFQNASHSSESSEEPRIIFAAQLEQVSPPHGEPPTSILTLNGKSAFLWTSYDTYVAIGYHAFDAEEERQTKALLERQLEARQ